MFRAVVLFACLALCQSHAVYPVVPAVHSIHTPLVVPYPYHGYAGHGLFGHGLVAKPLVHHLLKRSPHLVTPLAHVAPVAAIAPVAVSHQSRVDVHHSSPIVAAPVYPLIKPIAPIVAAPLLHKSVVGPYYGVGHYGGVYGGQYGAHY